MAIGIFANLEGSGQIYLIWKQTYTFDLSKLFLICLLFWLTYSFGQKTIRLDSCGINDACEKAIVISNVVSDQAFVCFEDVI